MINFCLGGARTGGSKVLTAFWEAGPCDDFFQFAFHEEFDLWGISQAGSGCRFWAAVGRA